MNTTELLAIIAPHREMLKGLGWAIEDYSNPRNVRVHMRGRFEVLYADLAALILEAVVMRGIAELVKYNSQAVFTEIIQWTDAPMHRVGIIDEAGTYVQEFDAPTRLAALLALLAWTGTQKGIM